MRAVRADVRTAGSATERADLLGAVDQVAALLPGVPRIAVLDVVDAEWARSRTAVEPSLTVLVVAAAVLRLRAGVDLIGA